MKLVRAWNGFWFGPISARPLGAFRIAFGLIALCNLGLLSIELDYWFTDVGLLQGNEAATTAGPLRYSILNYVQDPTFVRGYFAATALVIVLFTVGWHTRVMGVLLYLGMLSIHHRNIATANGSDVYLMVLAFYAMLSPCGAAFSLDARRAARKRGTIADPLILPWAQRLMQIHLALLYINTGLLKAGGASWQNGTALHYVLNNAEIRRFHFGLAEYPILINLMTYVALLSELAIPLLIWFRAARPWAILTGIGLHASILLFVNIPIFGELMVSTYLTFLMPDELDRFLLRLNPKTWLRPSGRAIRKLSQPDWDPGQPAIPGPHGSIESDDPYGWEDAESEERGELVEAEPLACPISPKG